jgi:hypothetical protein
MTGPFEYVSKHMVQVKKLFWYLAIVLLCSNLVHGQEFEPRSLGNLPVKSNFAFVGYAYSSGNVLLDPAISIENLDARVHGFAAGYLRSFNLFGKLAKIDAVLPYAIGDWEGRVEGIDTATSRNGFGDLRIRLSVNLIGSPALKMSEFRSYKQKTILGVNMQVIAPTGQYYSDKLLNLGSNRWTFRPQIGASHMMNRWIFEFYIGGWFFTKNSNFWGGNKLTQRPIGVTKVHVIHSFPKGVWLAADIGYGIGGRTLVNDIEKDSHISGMRFGLTAMIKIMKQHYLKLYAVSGVRFEKGSDYDMLGIAYQFNWSSKKAKL